MYSLFNSLKDEKFNLSYFGVFNDKITTMLIDMIEGQISKTENLNKLRKKVSFLIAESFQNIIRHGIIEKELISEIQYNKDFFQIAIYDERIVISSANVLENKNIAKLDEQINYINSLSHDELKSYFKDILINGTFSEKGGAGLGLIDMVRRSGLPLNKKFIPLTKGYSLIILSLEVIGNSDLERNAVDLDKIEALYKKLVEKGILMLYKGDFSSSTNSSLIEMLKSNFVVSDGFTSDKVKNIVSIIEVMQNVSKHGKQINGNKEGIFGLNIINGELFIECSNFIKQEEYPKLKKSLKEIKEKSMEQIEECYKEKLAKSYLSQEDNGGIGLLEIARFTNNTFTYNFVETGGEEIFYTIKIKTV